MLSPLNLMALNTITITTQYETNDVLQPPYPNKKDIVI